jgi:HlyD family secretion protein
LFNSEASETANIRTATARRDDITVSVNATGTVEPLLTVEVRSKASGAITDLHVEAGDTMRKGGLIAEVEKTYVQADVDKAEADLVSAQARLAQAQINIELQKEQCEIQIQQAQENVAEAETRLTKLQEDIELEKEANGRSVQDAENELEMAKLKLKQAQTPRQESVRKAEATVAQAKASLDLTQEEYNRYRTLYEEEFVSKAQMESTKAQFESARAQYESALEQLKMAEQPSSAEELKLAELSVTKAEIALEAAKHKVEQEKSREKDLEISVSQLEDARSGLKLATANKAQIVLKEKDLEAAQAAVTRAEVALEEAQDRLTDTVVTAPISGTILQKKVEEGQVITSSMGATSEAGTLVVTMADLENVHVNIEVDETDIGKVQADQSAIITVDAFPDRTFQGKVLRISPEGKAVQNVTTFEVITEIENSSRILKPGMNASVEILVADRQNVLVIDNEAIMDGPRGDIVIPVVDGETARPKQVELGVRGWSATEIISGLEEGEEVLISTPGQASSEMSSRMEERMKNPMSSFQRMQGGNMRPR